jgi:hypothetical protein
VGAGTIENGFVQQPFREGRRKKRNAPQTERWAALLMGCGNEKRLNAAT